MRDGRENTAQARRYYHHVINGGNLTTRDVGRMVEYLEAKDEEIANLRADLAAAREQVSGAHLAGASAVFNSIHDSIERQAVDGLNAEGEFSEIVFEGQQKFINGMRLAALNGRNSIRALSPSDAIAALEARDVRVRAEERAKVIEEVLGGVYNNAAFLEPDDWVIDPEFVKALHTPESRAAQSSEGGQQ